MAASKKNAKGNKTAHVLNLLTAPGAAKEGAPAAEEAPAEASAEQAQLPAPSRPLLPPILEVAQTNDDNLAQQIQHALEEELDEEAAVQPAAAQPIQITEEVPSVAAEQPIAEKTAEPPAPSGGKMSQEEIEKLLAASNAPAQPPAPEPAPAAPAASGGKMSQEEIEKLLAASNAPAQPPAPEPAPAAPAASGGKMSQEEIEKLLAASNTPAQPPAPEPAPAPAPEKPVSPPKPAPPAAEEISYTNIMQVLVEEKAPRYIKKFGLCPCKQCEADVKALTLTNLVPKYVVLSKMDRIPMLTVYEGRYTTTILAQLTRACKTVMDHPHHDRQEH